MAYKWHREGHINLLELIVILTMMKLRLRSSHAIGSRFLHFVDSMVALAVAAKRRSSSRQLNRILQQMDALELSGILFPTYGYCRSDKNPSDRPSRWA